jgi:hypothetical protein
MNRFVFSRLDLVPDFVLYFRFQLNCKWIREDRSWARIMRAGGRSAGLIAIGQSRSVGSRRGCTADCQSAVRSTSGFHVVGEEPAERVTA